MAFTCWYAVSGKKNGIAARGSSVTTADHRPLTPLLNWAPLGTGSSRVWGSVPGSEVLVAVVRAVVVPPGDDGLEGKLGRGLEDGEVRACLRRVGVLVHLDDEVGGHVLGLRGARVLVDAGRPPVHLQDLVASRPHGVGTLGADPSGGEQLGDTLEVPGIDPVGVGDDQVGDSRLGVHRLSVGPRLLSDTT